MSLHTAAHDTAPPALPATPAPPEVTALPRLTTTVPKEYVHRASLAEVFLTGCTAHSPERFTLTGQWPRTHALFTNPAGTHHDPLQVAETFRQAGMFLAHAELGVPLGHRFIMWDLTHTTHPRHLRITSRPTDFTLHAHCTDITWRRNTATHLRIHLTLHRDNHPIAHGAGTFSTIPPAVYQRLRAHTPPTTPHTPTPRNPLPPTTVGRTHPTDVVLTPTTTPHTWLLTPDHTHPILFDHTDDHLPGMVLLEAAHQATTTTHPHLTPTHTTTHFHHYAEHHHPTHIHLTTTTHPHHTTLHITGHQNHKTIFTTTTTAPTTPTT
ncbi:ScbA/BarX family gamma-butyrolactone biosynthesis protein [Streptomyces sp. NPDC048219]|uniref:ScbA/BarX family gamma-butyrolactone biosynthesis protein n=1 Tax=Streptomyces sp. NPDC048219 TaxID=3365517 RepID=UPI0037140E1E